MTATQICTRAWRDGAVVAESFSLAELPGYIKDEGCMAWADVTGSDPHALDSIAAELHLEPNAIEDAFSEHERPKLDRLPDLLFLNCYAVRFHAATADLEQSEISVFVTDRAVITVHREGRFDPAALLQRWDSTPDLLTYGVAGMLHGLLDMVVDGHFDAVRSLDEQIEALEDLLFDEEATARPIQRRIYTLRRALTDLRRVVLPMRDVLDTLLRRDYHLIAEDLHPYYHDIADHVIRTTEWIEGLRDLIGTAFETSLSLQDARLNNVMKKLTAWAAIIAVPTAVTGFYGQNVPYPGNGTWPGFVTSSGVIAITAVALYIMFRKRGWL